MTVTAWSNGKHHESGAGYGFKVGTADRDEFFKREWKFVILELTGVCTGVSGWLILLPPDEIAAKGAGP